MKRIKDNVREEDFKLLMNSLRGNEDIRPQRQQRLIRIFTMLYYLGIRVNECSQFTGLMISELINERKIKIIAHKQKSEKEILLSERGRNAFIKVFSDLDSEHFVFVSERGNKNDVLAPESLIRDCNSYLKSVFTDRNITSHSFRQTLITRLAEAGVNVKVIQEIVSHKSISSTYGYIKVTEDVKVNALNTL